MSRNYPINGTDFLMLGFDHELRRRGFAGNMCQIVLELDAPVDPEALRERLHDLVDRYPILAARHTGWFRPAWKPDRRTAGRPRVRCHPPEATIGQRLFNDPLRSRQGELLRFDLVEQPNGTSHLHFSWSHALMDAPGAEYFLALTGRDDIAWPESPDPATIRPRMSLPQRFRTARKNLFQIDEFRKTAPRSLGRRARNGCGEMHYRVERFSTAESQRVLDNASRHGGTLGAARYHAAVALVELHQLHQRLGHSSPSYVLPIPVGLRAKGSMEPMFHNQVTMLMTQVMPEHLQSVPDALARLKAQIEQALRDGMIESGRQLSDLSRCLPLPIFMAILKQGLRGEICSLFFGDTGAANPLLTRFLGASVRDLTHVAAVTPSPGLGVIYYSFDERLHATVLNLTNVVADAEAADFAANLRSRLLSP